MPDRIRQYRTGGWRKPTNAVCVTRHAMWGNPFTPAWAADENYLNGEQSAAEICTRMFVAWLDGIICAPVADDQTRRRRILTRLPDLTGRDLACYCPLPEPGAPDHCHAAVLLARANPAKDTP